MSRGLLIALGGGLLGAILFLSVRTGFFVALPLVYVSPLPLFAVGLSQGFSAALIAAATALIAVLAGTNAMVTGVFLLFAVVPMLIVTRQGLLTRPGPAPGTVEWYPTDLLLGWLAGYGLVVLAAIILWFAASTDGIEGVLMRQLDLMFERFSNQPMREEQRRLFAVVVRIFPGMMVSIWLLSSVACATMAQGLLTRLGRAMRPTPAFAEMGVARWIGPAAALAVLMGFLPGQFGTVGINAALVLATPFFLLGLSVIHVAMGRLGRLGPLRTLVYVLLTIVIMRLTWVAIFVVLLGIIEQWAQLRRRLAPPPSVPEDE